MTFADPKVARTKKTVHTQSAVEDMPLMAENKIFQLQLV